MKKSRKFFTLLFAVAGITAALMFTNPKKVEADPTWPCWFSQQYCCDTGGVVGCGVCDSC